MIQTTPLPAYRVSSGLLNLLTIFVPPSVYHKILSCNKNSRNKMIDLKSDKNAWLEGSMIEWIIKRVEVIQW